MTNVSKKTGKAEKVLASKVCQRNGERETVKSLLRRSKKGAVVSSPDNLHTILRNDPELAGAFSFDTFTSAVVLVNPSACIVGDEAQRRSHAGVCDSDVERLRAFIAATYELSYSDSSINAAVRVVAESNAKHAVCDYLDQLCWDGAPRVATLFPTYFGTDDDDYHRRCGEIMTVSAVARVRDPGCKVDTMLVLKGGQGVGKSTALSALAGVAWFSDTPLQVGSVDAFIALQGKWLVECSELASLRKSDSESFKGYVSSPVDKYRPKYGKNDVSVPRQCIFVGTTNEQEPLKDATGNRRFPIVEVGAVDLHGLLRDRDQIWAEACHLYASGRTWWPDTDAFKSTAAAIAALNVQGDPWADVLDGYMRLPAGRYRLAAGVRLSDILHEVLNVPPGVQTKAHRDRLGKVLNDRTDLVRRREATGERKEKYYLSAGDAGDAHNTHANTQHMLVTTTSERQAGTQPLALSAPSPSTSPRHFQNVVEGCSGTEDGGPSAEQRERNRKEAKAKIDAVSKGAA